HSERTTSYPHFSEVLKYNGINFPIQIKDIVKFEKMNNLSINVYGLESDFSGEKSDKKSDECVIIPVYLSKSMNSNVKTIHLLIIQTNINLNMKSDDYDDYEPIYHFALINNLSALVTSSITQTEKKHFFCDRCLNHFKIRKSFERHRKDCLKINKVHMVFPTEENKILKFKNFQYQDTVPFVIYADLECTLTPIDDDTDIHIPHSIAFYRFCNYN
ncbi:GSCOCG00012693001-RA-CDS, partial [Cotesia congregata]